MKSCMWVLVCGLVTTHVTTAGAEASETHVVSGMVCGSCAPTDDGLGPCCFPSDGVAFPDGCNCGSSHRAFSLWKDYRQDPSCAHGDAYRGSVVQLSRVQPRALLNPIKPSRSAYCARQRRTPVEWMRDLFGWPASRCTGHGSCGSCGQVVTPVVSDPDVGPTPMVDESPAAVSEDEPSLAVPEANPEPTLPPDPAPDPDGTSTQIPAPAATPEPTPEPKWEPAVEPQPADTPVTKANDGAASTPTEPTLDAPVPGDVIPDPQPQPEPEKAASPAAPESTPDSPVVPEQDVPPAVPENVLPPSTDPAATPASHHRDSSRAVPVRKAGRLSEYIRVR